MSFPFVPGHEVVGRLVDRRHRASCSSPCCAARPRHRPVVRRLRRRRPRQLRAHRVRPPRARPAERLLLRHRRRLVDADGRPHEPAARRPRRRLRRGRGDGRAHRLRGARRAARRHRHGDTVVVLGPARSVCSPSPPCAATRRVGTVIAVAKHPMQRDAGARRSAPTSSSTPTSRSGACAASPARSRSATATSCASPAAPTTSSTASAATEPRSRRRSRSCARRARSSWSACPATSHVDLTGLWHREIELVRRATPTAPSPADGVDAAPSTSPSSSSSGRPRSARVAPPIPSPATTTPSTHAANAGRAGAVKIAFDLRTEKERDTLLMTTATRLRARRRPVDAADPVPPRRGLPAREAARRPHPRHLPGRAARAAGRPRRRHPPRAAATRSATPSPCPRCCARA